MKIANKDKERLFSTLDKGIMKVGIDKVTAHKAKNLGIDKAKRFRWDIFHLGFKEIRESGLLDKLYTYLYDEHIDTALKEYIKTRNLL